MKGILKNFRMIFIIVFKKNVTISKEFFNYVDN